MGFFEGAYNFEVNGGNFYDIRGDQINRVHDASLKVGGSQNKLDVKPDMSRQDNRSFNTQEQQIYPVYDGSTQGPLPSTTAGYGQMPPTVSPMSPQGQTTPGQPPYDPQALVAYQRWMEYYRYQQWLVYMNLNQHSQQASPQTQFHPDPHQQPAQESAVPSQFQYPNERGAPYNAPQQQFGGNSSAFSERRTRSVEIEDEEEDEDIIQIRENLDRQHINLSFHQ